MVGAPNERWVIDLTGPYPTSGDGSKFIFTAICAFSKFVVTATIKKKKSNDGYEVHYRQYLAQIRSSV
jgi:hypothetical protein